MTSLALGIAGAAIGYFTGGASFVALGFLAGSLVGSLIDPPKVQGPRLGDLKLQRSTYGIAWPWLWGTGRIAGNVIDQTDLEEHEQKSGGKGGPEVTNYTYSASFAIGICQTPIFDRDAIIGILRIWADARLIWDESTGEASPCTVYVGSEDQLPDPTFEAIHGVGNQPAYRGIAYVVFTDYTLTDFGNRIPSLEFEVYTKAGDEVPNRISTFSPWDSIPGAVSPGSFSYSYHNGIITVTALESSDYFVAQYQKDGTQIGSTTTQTVPGGGTKYVRNTNSYYGHTSPTDPVWITLGEDGALNVGAALDGTDEAGLQGVANIYQNGFIYGDAGGSPNTIRRFLAPNEIPGHFDALSANLDSNYAAGDPKLGTSDTGDVYVMVSPVGGQLKLWKFDADLNLVHFWDVADTAGTRLTATSNMWNFHVYKNQIIFNYPDGGFFYIAMVAINPDTYALTDIGTPLIHADSFVAPLAGCLMIDRDGVFSVCAPPAPVLLSEIVGDLTENTPLATTGSPPEVEYDVSELTDEVRWYVLGSQMTVRNAIQGLRPIFFFDAVESDDLVKFRKRGITGSVATIPDDDLCARPFGEDAGDPLLTIRKREQGLPRTVTLTYIDVDNDYQTGAQSSPRQTTLSEQDVTLEVAVGLTADEALQKCLTVHTAEWVERESFEWATTRKWAYLEPCDVVTVRGRVIRIRQRTEAPDGTIRWEGVQDAPSLYEQNAPGAPSEGFTPQEPPGLPVDTQLVLLDIPILSLQDAPHGFYAAMGPATVGRWSGAGLYKSLDGGTSYSLVASTETASVIGATADSTGSPVISGALSAYGGGDVVEEASLCVVLTDADAELVSVTADAFANGANLCAISRGTTSAGSPSCEVILWELLQFRDAVLIEPNTYVLTGFLRGRKGTSTSGHSVGDRFVLLPVTNVDAPAQETGVCLDYKAVTYGQALADATARDFINTGLSADEFFDDVGGSIPPFTGDTGSPSEPTQGAVPAPEVGDCAAGKFLSACGTWEVMPTPDVFVGDSGSPYDATSGLVPAPALGDCADGKYLDACGNWSVPAGTGASAPDYILLQDQKSSGTGGGNAASTSYQTRVLNTEVVDSANHCSLSSNQFTLSAGTYYISASAPSYNVGRNRIKLRNVTDASDIMFGTSSYEPGGADRSSTRSIMNGRFTIASSKALELQHYTQASAATVGLGVDASSGDIEIYAQVELWKLA